MKDTKLLLQRNGVIITTYIGGEHRRLTNTDKRIEARNYSLADFYLLAISRMFSKQCVSEKHIVLDVPEDLSDKLMLTNAEEDKMDIEGRMEWYKMNSYCVQVESDLDEHSKFALMSAHVDQCFQNLYGIRAEYKEIKTKCSENSIVITNGKLSSFICLVNNHEKNFLQYPTIDETKWQGDVNIQISADLLNPDIINSQLEIYNLKLVEAERNIKKLVISMTD